MAIDLEKHKVYVDSLKMDMVPYSIAVQAVQEIQGSYTDDYLNKLEEALAQLQTSVNNVKFND
jgi:hypothetical protein